MTRETEDLLERALRLPAEGRATLAQQLIESLDDAGDEGPAAVERAWAEEIKRRLREVREGHVKTIPWDEAMANARAAVEQVRAKKRRG